MSIPALNNTSDYDVYFKQYLKSLELQNDLNKKNFDANYAFKKTGVQETERPDMRPIEERMSDVEKLKVQARMMLNKVTDANNTNEIMQYLLQNDNILFFFIQNFPALEEVVKRQFSGGILASQMISLIYKAYLKYTDEVLIPDSADFDLVKSIVTQEDIQQLINIADNANLILKLNQTKDDYPTQSEIDKLIKNPEQYVNEIHDFAKKYKNGLTQDDILPLLDANTDRKILQTARSEDTVAQQEQELFDKIFSGIERPTKEKLKVPSKELSRKPTKSLFEKAQASQDAKLKKLLEQEQKDEEKIKKMKNDLLELMKTNQKAKIRAKEEQIRKANEKKAKKDEKTRIAAKNVAIIKKQNQEKAAAQAAAQAQPAPQAQPTVQGTGLLDNREKHIHRFKVLKGEVLAGNLSSSVIKELKSLVVKMINFNELEPPQALTILKELNKIK